MLRVDKIVFMKHFFEKNKIFIAIIIAGLIVGGVIYVVFGPTPSPPECLAPPEATITKVLDGDTVVVEGGHHIRLLGIDADERGYPCYEEAKSYLEELVLNKETRLEKDRTDVDQYNRCLRYIFLPAEASAEAGLDDKNINLQLVKEGQAICRFYEPDTKYRDECMALEKEAIENKIGRKWSGKELSTPVSPKEFEKLTPEKTGLEIVFVCNAGNYLGKEVIIEGKIVDTYRSKTNTVFLNFEKAYPNQCFTSVIFSSDQYKFVQSPEDYYLNKTVRIKGEIKEYEGRAEIILKHPSQIEVGE